MAGLSPMTPDNYGAGDGGRGYHSMGMGSMLPQDVDGGYFAPSEYSAAEPEFERFEDERVMEDSMAREDYEDEDSEEYAGEDIPEYEGETRSVMPPIGDWYEANSLEDQEREIRRMLANKNNVLAFPLNTHFTISDLEGTEWKLSDMCTHEGESSPYVYKDSGFHDDRAIKNIFLKSVSQDSPVSVGVTASLIHPNSERETMMFTRPYVPASGVSGPCHISLKPIEASNEKVLLWTKDYSKPVPEVVTMNPSVTQRDLKKSLREHPRDRRLRTLLSDDILLQYVKERIKLGLMPKDDNPISWQAYDGYGVIDAHRADVLTQKFIRDQSRGLYLKNIWDLRVKLSRGGLPSISSDASEDNSELMSKVPAHCHGDSKELSGLTSLMRKSVPHNLWWTLQIELEPEKH